VNKAESDLEASSKGFVALRKMLDKLKKDFKKRTKSWSKQLKRSTRIVSANFGKYLQRKGFSGEAVFDHGEATLSLQCQVDATNDATKVRRRLSLCLDGGGSRFSPKVRPLAPHHASPHHTAAR